MTLSSAEAGALIETLREHDGAAAALVELSQRQRHAVERGSSQALLSVLAQRQAIIDRFVTDQSEVAQRCRMIQESKEVPAAQREEIRSLVEAINKKFEIVLARDGEDEQCLRENREQMRDELQSGDAARHARRAYLGRDHSETRFADERG